jgi:hypothetical protein
MPPTSVAHSYQLSAISWQHLESYGPTVMAGNDVPGGTGLSHANRPNR